MQTNCVNLTYPQDFRTDPIYAFEQLNVITKPGGTPKRTLICFSFKKQVCLIEELLTEVSRHQYSEEYIALTREYYLNMK